jgi:23S rRNA maturation-related 3'-5' exoribonuclease YhaM
VEKDYKKLITNELLSTEVGGINELLERMEKIGYFTAPCSGGNHLAKEGGLAEHSWNVLQVMANLADALEVAIPSRSIILTALLHDLGKCGDHGKANYVPNILKSGEQSTKKPYETNKDLLYIPHEVRSIKIASEYIPLTEDEEWAILMHNGLYGDFKYSIQGKETPLYLLLHTADMWASRVLEVKE